MPNDDDLQMIAAAPVLIDSGYICVTEDASGTFKLMDVATFGDVSRDFVIEKIQQYEIAIRMSKRLLGFLDEGLPVPSQQNVQETWRWLCVACCDEGHGLPPEVCPECQSTDRWYATGAHAADPRSMKDIYKSSVWGNPSGRIEH